MRTVDFTSGIPVERYHAEASHVHRYQGMSLDSSRIDETTLQQIMAAIMELAPMKWAAQRMQQPGADEVTEQARYKRTRELVDRYGKAGTWKDSATIEAELGLSQSSRPTDPDRYAHRPMPVFQAPDPSTSAKVLERHNSNAKAGKYQSYSEIEHELSMGR